LIGCRGYFKTPGNFAAASGFEIFEQMRKETNELAKLLKQEREMVERQLAELAAPTADGGSRRSQLLILEQQLPEFDRAQ